MNFTTPTFAPPWASLTSMPLISNGFFDLLCYRHDKTASNTKTTAVN
jgi:hypothetical protein